MFERLSAWTAQNVRWLFAVALVVVFVAHVSTVTFYPAPWLDEVQLIENGRCIVFERTPSWALIFRGVPGSACALGITPTYLSGAVAEAIDRGCGVWWAHRVFSILGLFAATGLCLLWLRRKGFALPVACGMALLFCTDVHLTKSAHFYRPDPWALAMLFATALTLNRMGDRQSRLSIAAFLGLGFAMAIQVVFWFSSLFGLTLIVAEFFALARLQAWPWRVVAERALAVVVGGLTGILAFVVLPFPHRLSAFVLFLFTHPDVQSMYSGCAVKSDLGGLVLGHVRDLAVLLVRAPFIWSMALAGLLVGFRRWRMFGGLLVGSLLFLLFTRAYCFRIIYFLPLAAFFAATAWSEGLRRTEATKHARTALVLFVAVALGYGIGFNVIDVNAIAASGPRGGARAALKQDLETLVGRGPQAVCLFSWQPYFIGRELGWRMFATMPFDNKLVFNPHSAKMLTSLDFVLEQEFGAGVVEDNGRAPLTDEERSQLRAAGFVPIGRAGVVDVPTQAATNAASLASRLRNFVWASEYPSYTIWKNTRTAGLR